jgi:uncharacterized pyridoxamine 5'-phosphate oxidase family protein
MTGMQAIRRYVEKKVTCFMATMEDRKPRVRPMATAVVEETSLLFATSDASDKMDQIRANPAVELCYMGAEWDHARVRGRAERVTDEHTKKRVWDEVPELEQFWDSPENDDYVLIRVHIEEVLYMDVSDREYRSLETHSGE